MTIADIVEKRKKRWEERRDIEYDRMLCSAAAVKILSNDNLRAEVLDKPYLLIEAVFCVVNKNGKTVPFFLNDVQKSFIAALEKNGTKNPYFILKGRQQGFTTLITAIQLAFAVVRRNFSGITMADRADNTRAIFNDKAKMMYDLLPDILKPTEKYNNAYELSFSKLNSSWRIATATDEVGRSRTLNFVHFSEVAFYGCSLATLQSSIGEAIVAGAIVVYETTANGFNQAKELWDSGACNNLFYEWWQTAEYRSDEYKYLDGCDTWLTERLKVLSDKGLDREQLCWYAKKYAGYLDKTLICQEYPCSPEEAFVASGYSVFDKEAVGNRILSLTGVKYRTGEFEFDKAEEDIVIDGVVCSRQKVIKNIKFVEKENGAIKLHSEPRVIKDEYGNVISRCPYAIGGDTAGSGEDFFAAKVVDCLTGKTVATYHRQRVDEDEYALQVYCLGKYYNDALIGVETNYSREPVRVLQEYVYPNLYMRQRVDGMSDKTELVCGFETTSKTRPIIIAELIRLMRENKCADEVDIDTLREMTTFVKKDNGRIEASGGAHDDLVMALAIAHWVRRQAPSEWIEDAVSHDGFFDNFDLDISRSAAKEYMDWGDL